MGAEESKPNASISSTSVGTYKAVVSGTKNPKERVVQNFILVWVDANINESSKDCQNSLNELRKVVNYINIYTQSDRCIKFLKAIENEKVFVIVSGSLGEHLVHDIHNLQQVDAIHIFCRNISRHEKWTKAWKKIKGVYNNIEPICQALQQAAKQCDQDSTTITFVNPGEHGTGTNLNQLDPSFMYSQIFKETLLEMEYDEKSIKYLTNYCRRLYPDNRTELEILDEFEHGYRSKTPIWWYTRNCFTYQMMNRALRTLEGDTIINMGFFMRDLHKQIQELYQEQINTYHGKSFIVYRGQGLSEIDFDRLTKTKGGLMSFNNFLSTSTKRKTALKFTETASVKTDTIGILFKMTIERSISSAPFAFIEDYSFYENEGEVLFSMHTIFRVGEIKEDPDGKYYQVDLKLVNNDDKQLRALTERIRMEVGDETGWRRLGKLLLRLHQFNKAEELYNLLLIQTSSKDERAYFYHQLGHIKDKQGDQQKAIEYYENVLEILEKSTNRNYPLLAASYNNIGTVYKNMAKYSEALSFYETALETYKKAPSVKPLDLAVSYNNIGSIYNSKGEYEKALLFYEKSFEIRQKNLSSDNPSLATSYNNIGLVYKNMRNYSKALKYYELALQILQISLPSNHPHIKDVQQNIKLVKEKF